MRCKESSGALSGMTLDRISNALTYRVYGEEAGQDRRYETYLADYEKKMILANLWENTLQPIYKVIAMIGTVLVIWFGGHNVQGTGWENWDIAAFSTYLACFIKLRRSRPMRRNCSTPSRKPRYHGSASSPISRRLPSFASPYRQRRRRN